MWFFLKATVPAGGNDEPHYELMTKTGLWVWWRQLTFSSGASLIAVYPASAYRAHRHSALLAYPTQLRVVSPCCHCCDTDTGELGVPLWLLQTTYLCLRLSEQAHAPVPNMHLAGTMQFLGVERLSSLFIYLQSPLAYGQSIWVSNPMKAAYAQLQIQSQQSFLLAQHSAVTLQVQYDKAVIT